MDFTSLMILGFAAASKDSSLTAKMVFSFGFSCEQLLSGADQRHGHRHPVIAAVAGVNPFDNDHVANFH